MADDTSLLVFWTGLAIFLGIYVLLKYRRNYGRQRAESSQSAHDIKGARLKYFSMNKEVALDGANMDVQRTEDEIVLAHDSWEEGRGDEKSSDTAAAEADGIGFRSSVRYTRTIDPPRTDVFGIGTGNSAYDPETGCPITRPLSTLDEVLSWRQGFDCFNVAKVPFIERCRKLENRPRTLVCHDMKGGYIEDRFVQGYNSCDCYVIYQWQMIDIFVYFSHHFVTIPPPCWSNAAHTHGVPVLGTLITESEDGIKKCEKFLEKKASWETLANQLVDIAEYYRFDGWFINVENHIQPFQVKNLEEFVKYLTRAVHERIEGSLVIWYDSVTYKGDLMWQNELNSSNRIFFDACDGIFLNYLWSEAHLMRSVGAAGRQRIHDVYVGVDVFGRGCFGGGGYNCNKAFKVIREENLSAALFAPGWVMETQGTVNFIAHQDKFWNLLAPYCALHSPVKMVPFVTSMCRGYGKNVMLDGMVVYFKPWTNLSGQQCQPTYNNMFFNLATKGGLTLNSIKYTTEEAYNGGGCYMITGQVKPSQTTSKGVARLFKTALQITSPMLVSFTFKLRPSDCVEVLLQLRINRLPTYILLCPPSLDNQDGNITVESDFNKKLLHRYGIPHSGKVTSSAFMSPIGEEHYELFAPLTGIYHDSVQQAHARDSEVNDTAWCTRHYVIGEKQFIGCTVEEIRVVCATLPGASVSDEFELHLGEIKIVDPRILKQPLACVRNIRGLDVVWKNVKQGQLLSLTLMWDCPIPDGEGEEAAHYNVFRVAHGGRQTTFLGRAFVEAYRVCQLPVARESVSVEFVVQVVTRSGLKRPLDECSRVQFNWA